MKLEQAKIICLAHVEYVLNGIKNDYTVTEIGIAIDVNIDCISESNIVNLFVLVQYQLWRRGNLEHYPKNSTHNMNILKESVYLC
jgi:hypothetical protein